MTITAGFVLYSGIWFLTFYVVLQVRTQTQRDVGEVVPGTPPGAPATESVGRSAKIATLFATLIWAVVAAVIISGVITLKDLDVFNRLKSHQVE